MSDTPVRLEATPTLRQLWFQAFNEIGIINQLSTTELNKVLPHGLTQAQFTVLNHCMRLGDNKTPAQLADAFQLTRGTLTTTLKRLNAKAFIALVPDAKDQRSKRVMLTEAGRQAHADSIAAIAPLLDEVIAGLPRALVEALIPPLQDLRIFLDTRRSS